MESPTAWPASDVRLVRDINYPDNITLLLPPPLPSPLSIPGCYLVSAHSYHSQPPLPSPAAWQDPAMGAAEILERKNISFLYKTLNMLRPHYTLTFSLARLPWPYFPYDCSTQFLPGYSRFQSGLLNLKHATVSQGGTGRTRQSWLIHSVMLEHDLVITSIC